MHFKEGVVDKSKVEKIISFLNKYCYRNGSMVDDCIPITCNFCGAGGWLPEDIKHKKGCELGKIYQHLKQSGSVSTSK